LLSSCDGLSRLERNYIWSWTTVLVEICWASSKKKGCFSRIRSESIWLRLFWLSRSYIEHKLSIEILSPAISSSIPKVMPVWLTSDWANKPPFHILFVEALLIWLLRCCGEEVIQKCWIGICLESSSMNVWRGNHLSGIQTRTNFYQISRAEDINLWAAIIPNKFETWSKRYIFFYLVTSFEFF